MPGTDEPLSATHLRFLGKVLATFSHELKNHLAVIAEYNGLVEDLLEMGTPPRGEDSCQYVTAVRAVNRQIERTLALTAHFNRFSHSMDSREASFDLNEALEDLLALIGRLANQARVGLERQFQRPLPTVRGNAALLQLLAFCLLEQLLRRAEPGAVVLLRTTGTGNGVAVELVPRGDMKASAGEAAFCAAPAIEEILRELGGELRRSGGGSCRLTIPLAGGMGKRES